MIITLEFKKLFLEFFSRVAIAFFIIGIATPFAAGKLSPSLAIRTSVSILFCLIIASLIALTVKEKEV